MTGISLSFTLFLPLYLAHICIISIIWNSPFDAAPEMEIGTKRQHFNDGHGEPEQEEEEEEEG